MWGTAEPSGEECAVIDSGLGWKLNSVRCVISAAVVCQGLPNACRSPQLASGQSIAGMNSLIIPVLDSNTVLLFSGLKETYKAGDEVIYTCHRSDGSVLTVKHPRTCQPDGSWSGGLPDCSDREQVYLPTPATKPDSIVFPGSQEQNVIAIMPGGFWVPQPNGPVDSVNVGTTKKATTAKKSTTTTTPVPMLPEFDYYYYDENSVIPSSQEGDIRVNSIDGGSAIASKPAGIQNNILRNSEETAKAVETGNANSETSSEGDKSSTSTKKLSECLLSVCILLLFKSMATR